MDASSASQKRSKVSRACDECRRKKIRCDAAEGVAGPCSNCRRSNTPCAFSRQPLKRGPSKGYIKSLASRVESLESQLNHNASGTGPDQTPSLPDPNFFPEDGTHLLQPHMGDGPEQSYSPPRTANRRKRTHSTSENAQNLSRGSNYNVFSVQGRSANDWNEPLRPMSRQQASTSQPQTPQATPLDLSQAKGHPSPSAHSLRKNELDDASGRDMAIPFYQGETREGQPAGLSLDLDEIVIDEYYRLIHLTFPLLSHSRNDLKRRLSHCPGSLQSAFCAALETAIRAYPSTLLQPLAAPQQSERKAAELIAACQYVQPVGWSMENELVYLQTLILMALESDNFGPDTMRGQLRPPRSEWLGRAIGFATHLKLNAVRSRELSGADERDSDDKLGRRIWWILLILDRWHASSTSSLLQLPDNGSTLIHDDQLMMGETSYHLIRQSSLWQTCGINLLIASRPVVHSRSSHTDLAAAGGTDVADLSSTTHHHDRHHG